MVTLPALVCPLLAALSPRLGDLLVGGIVLALAVYGAQNGLFLAVLAGMHALVSLVVALSFAEPLGDLLVSFELPAVHAFPTAFGVLLVGTAMGIRLLVGAYVPAEVVRFAPLIDKIGGGLVGLVAGIIVAGTTLIAFSVAPLPEALRIDGSQLSYDMGTKMLNTFARCVEPDEAKRAILLDGEPGSVPDPTTAAAAVPVAEPAHDDAAADEHDDKQKHPRRHRAHHKSDEAQPEPPPAAPAQPPVPHWSEPFADTNGNKTYDEGEPYLDTDHDKAFTHRLTLNDANGDGKREVGLLERYRLHAWGRHVISVLAADEIMPAAADSASALKGGDGQAAAPTGGSDEK